MPCLPPVHRRAGGIRAGDPARSAAFPVHSINIVAGENLSPTAQWVGTPHARVGPARSVRVAYRGALGRFGTAGEASSLSIQVEALRCEDGGLESAHGSPASGRTVGRVLRLAPVLKAFAASFGAATLAAKARRMFAAIGLLLLLGVGLGVVYYQRAEAELGHISTVEHLAYGLVNVSTHGENLLRDLTIPADVTTTGARALAEHWMAELSIMRPEGLLAAALAPQDVTAFEYDLHRLEGLLTAGVATQALFEEFRSDIEMVVHRYVAQAQQTLIELRRRHFEELETAKSRRQHLMIAFVALFAGAFTGIAVMVGLFITRLLHALAVLEGRSQSIAAGDYGEPIPVQRDDEVGHLMQAVNTMACKLAERDREINTVRQQTAQQEKMLALGTLAASIAHEVGNPLQSIMAMCDQLADCLCAAPCARRDVLLGHADRIADHAGRMARILDGVRNFARPSVPEFQTFDLNRVVGQTLDLMRFEPRLASIPLNTELAGEPLFIEGVPDHLVQILMNLLINAADAVNPETGRIVVSTRREERIVVLAVSDNGPGIPEGVRKAVFEPFFTTKPEGKGTGLGLSVCRSIVKDHGGKIEIASSPEQGTSILVRLPYSGCAA